MTVRIVTLPSFLMESVTLEYIRSVSVARMEGRRTETDSSGQGYWRASLNSTYMTLAQSIELDAFSLDMTSPGAVFAPVDCYHPRPQAAQAPLADNAGGKGAVTAITDPVTLRVGSLPIGFQLSRGDRVEVRMSETVRSLHMVMEDAVASSAGSATFRVEPPIDKNVFDTTAEAIFEKPSCLMMIDQGFGINKAWNDRRASFTATEVFINGA